MLKITLRLLELSMRLEQSRFFAVRLAGKLMGILPVWYAERKEKELRLGSRKPTQSRKKQYHRRCRTTEWRKKACGRGRFRRKGRS